MEMLNNRLNSEVTFTVEDMEEQQRRLSDSIERLEEGLLAADDAGVEEVIDRFLHFAKSHLLFHTLIEEVLMYERHYPSPDYYEHLQQHRRLIEDLEALQQGRRTRVLNLDGIGPRERAVSLARALRGWTARHAEQLDTRLIDYLRTSDAAPAAAVAGPSAG